MSSPDSDNSRLVAEYIRYSESLNAARRSGHVRANESDRAAYESIHETIRDGPPSKAWLLVTAILRAVPDDKLGVYAAGPLESLVKRWGAALVDEIESEADRDERFRWALGVIWLTELGFSQSDSERKALARIVAASSGRTKVVENLLRRGDGSTSA